MTPTPSWTGWNMRSAERRSGGAAAPDRTLVAGLTVATLALLTAGWVLSGVLVADDVPPLTVATGRAAGSTFALLAIALATTPARQALARTARRGRSVLLLAFLGYFVYFAGTMLGVRSMGASNTGLVVALLPCVTFAIGMAAFGERFTRRKAWGTAVAVAGAFGYALDAASTDGTSTTTDLLVGGGWTLLATATFALYNYLYREALGDLPPLGALPVVFAVATAMLLPVAALTESMGDVSARQWLGTLLLGAVLTAPVYVTAHELVLRRGPMYMAALSLLVPLLVRITEWSLGNAPALDAAAVLTMAACLTGVAITMRPAARTIERAGHSTSGNGRKLEHAAGHTDQPEQDPPAHHPLRPGHPDDVA
ncbi:DMT family transporter [Streptomyces sp. NPDC008313]|uniref:DMT family transporter n=1 Tax=Streptomyces sp. NPDC008313 TaxID=3364826 RepID=UPI0036F0D82F